ncbi:patatin-like protein 6 [Canna indica]|uniref:Patatin-like protein 6 n=1 Tax=Canna indica TaxID=4628 RepID=A0AAQ3KEQ6_9LILI|nr:patatin-like protein 6 [Canna indica]
MHETPKVATSTGVGGVFTAMSFATHDASLPLLCADETWHFLTDRGKCLFLKASPSSSSSSGLFLHCLSRGSEGSTMAVMERAIKEAFGEGLTPRHTMKPVLISCYDLRSSALLVFSCVGALENKSFDF